MGNILDIAKDIKSFDGKENVRKVLEYFNNPQDKIKTIHVAGTNGKGSICNYINNILIENNYKVGLFTSPHIFENTDRFKINNINISENEMNCYYEEIVNIAKKLEVNIHQFDIATIVAFRYFNDNNCDFAIIEVGLGGRIDSTNIIKKPLVSVIGKIGRDHTDILGNNIEEIAFEKAGIIKKNSPVIVYNQEKEILDIILSKAKEEKSEYIIPDFNNISIEEMNIEYISFNYLDENYIIHMTNIVQVYNAVISLEIAFLLSRMGFKLNIEKIKKGISKTKIAGRFQKVHDNPLIILDGAHNVESVKELNKTLKKYYPNEKFVFVVSFFKDKEYVKLIEIIAPLAYAFITCETDSTRSVKSEELISVLGIFCDKVHNVKSIENALDIAIKNYKENKIIVFGSLSLIKNTIQYFK